MNPELHLNLAAELSEGWGPPLSAEGHGHALVPEVADVRQPLFMPGRAGPTS